MQLSPVGRLIHLKFTSTWSLPKLGNNNIVQKSTDTSSFHKTAIKLNKDFSTEAPLTFMDHKFFAVKGSPVAHRMFSCTPGSYPINGCTTLPPSYDNQKWPQVEGRGESLWLKITCLKLVCYNGMPTKFLGPNAMNMWASCSKILTIPRWHSNVLNQTIVLSKHKVLYD